MIQPIKVVNPADPLNELSDDAPMSAEQKAELAELCRTLDEPMDENLTQALAKTRIDALKDIKAE